MTPKIVRIVSFLLLIAFMNNCSYKESPLATNFRTTKQKKLQSASHWKVIGNDLAKYTIQQIRSDQELHVEKMQNDNKFSQAIYNFFLGSLVKNGKKVSVIKRNKDLDVRLNIEVVKFSRNIKNTTNMIGKATALTAGVWAVYGLSQAENALSALAVGSASAAIGTDAYTLYSSEYASGMIPQYEIIVTVSVKSNNIYVTHFSNVYYIADNDNLLYQKDNYRIIRLKGE